MLNFNNCKENANENLLMEHTRMAKIKKIDNAKCWQGRATNMSLGVWSQECEVGQPLWQTGAFSLPPEVKMDTYLDLAPPFCTETARNLHYTSFRRQV